MANKDNYEKAFYNLQTFVEAKYDELETLFSEGEFDQGVALLKEAADAEQTLGAFKALAGLVDYWEKQREAKANPPVEPKPDLQVVEVAPVG